MFNFQCPICQKQLSVARREDAAYRPFCSQRCKMVDLGRWLDGSYAVSEPIARSEGEQQASEGTEE